MRTIELIDRNTFILSQADISFALLKSANDTSTIFAPKMVKDHNFCDLNRYSHQYRHQQNNIKVYQVEM